MCRAQPSSSSYPSPGPGLRMIGSSSASGLTPKTLLPALYLKQDWTGDLQVVELFQTERNTEIPSSVFDTTTPDAASGWNVQINRWRGDADQPNLEFPLTSNMTIPLRTTLALLALLASWLQRAGPGAPTRGQRSTDRARRCPQPRTTSPSGASRSPITSIRSPMHSARLISAEFLTERRASEPAYQARGMDPRGL